MSNEIEVKLEAPEGFTLPEVEGFDATTLSTVRLHATYWDTDELDLLSWGVAVRHRSADDGSESGWTVKIADGDSTERREIELAGDAMMPPTLVDAICRPFAAGRPLRPVAEITTCRERTQLASTAGRVEVANDEVGSSVGGEQGPRFREIEVELLDGDRAVLDAVVEHLVAGGLRRSPSPSKLTAVLSAHRELPAPAAAPAPLTHRSSVGHLVRWAVADGTRRLLLHAAGAQTGDDPEDVHQARVATRRLRSDLATLAPLLDTPVIDAVRGELRWIAGRLGAVRDLDVLHASLGNALDHRGQADDTAAQRLRERVREERRRAAVELRDALASDRYVMLARRLVTLADDPPIAPFVRAGRRASSVAPRLANRAWRRTRTVARRLGESPSDAELHRLRRRAKRARYAAELVAPVVDRHRASARAKCFAELQSTLGDLQDALVARRWLEAGIDPSTPGDEAFLSGLLAADHERSMDGVRRSWPDVWRRAARTKPIRRRA